jgi:acyl carrier protein
MTMTREQITADLLRRFVEEYDAPETTTPDTAFEEIEFDSLVLVEVAVGLTKEYGVEVAEEELQRAGSVAATAELLLAKSAVVA